MASVDLGVQKRDKETSNPLFRLLPEDPNIHAEPRKDLFNITTSVASSFGGNKPFSRPPTSGTEGS